MPVCKSQLRRLLIYNAAFVSPKKYWTKHELLARLLEYGIDISESTFKNDLDTLRAVYPDGFNAPLKFCSYRKAYYYDADHFSLFGIPMTPENTAALHLAKLLAQDEAFKILTHLINAVERHQSVRH